MPQPLAEKIQKIPEEAGSNKKESASSGTCALLLFSAIFIGCLVIGADSYFRHCRLSRTAKFYVPPQH